jgi:sporulation protein YlmC with PRC-barrel domain
MGTQIETQTGDQIGKTPSGHTQAIRAKKVIGTSVHDSAGDHIGKIEDIVLDKLSNNIMFAIVGAGGVLGVGEKFFSVPWQSLDDDEGDDAYVIDMTKDEIEKAPADTLAALTGEDSLTFRQSSYDYYAVAPYW